MILDVVTETQEKLQSSSVWRQIEAEFQATGLTGGVLQRLTEATDAIARHAFRTFIAPVCAENAAVLAVGAYGRQETFPYSGADIVILLDRSPDSDPVKNALASFARQLWDAGLRLHQMVRTVAECFDTREQNLDLIVNLLDRRFLSGSLAIEAKLESRLPAVLSKHARDIVQHISRSAELRHARYQNTGHHLEPDVKEAPGGLRDLALIGWLSRLNPEDQPANERVKELALYPSSARCYLHYHAGRDANVLDFEAQGRIGGQAFTSGKKPTEWLHEYLRNARLTFIEARRALEASERRHSSLLDSVRDYRARLSNAEFTVSRDRLLLRSPAQLDHDPELILRLLEFVARHGVTPAPETERRLEATAPPLSEYCAQPRPLWPALKNILAAPHAFMALKALENARLMTALLPEWADIEDLPDPEPELRYTVDEHTLGAIQAIDRLQTAADPAHQKFSELFSEIDNPALLRFALLFHRTGKGESDSLRAAVDRARNVVNRIEMPAGDRATVEFLIGHQRDLAATISGRDIDDPNTIRALAETAGTVELLKLLTLLTYADISAKNPHAMTPWRMDQLWRTYSSTRQELTRELETDRIREIPKDLPGDARFIKGFPVRYLRSRHAGEIQAHLRLFESSRPTGVAVELDQEESAYRLTVVARDRPALFAGFAGAITSFGLDILKAEAFSNAEGVILDTFLIADPKRMLQQNPPEVERLRDLIQRLALGRTDVRRLMRNRPQESKKRSTPPEVRFDSETCETATLVEVVTEDRPGLLYSLATVFSSHNCNIDIVLIDTKGQRAIDVFYVAYQGVKLFPEMQVALRDDLLAAC